MSKTSRIILWCVLIAVLAMCIVLYAAAKRPAADTTYRDAGKTYAESMQPGDETPVITGGDFTITAHTFENMRAQNRASGMTEAEAAQYTLARYIVTRALYYQALTEGYEAADAVVQQDIDDTRAAAQTADNRAAYEQFLAGTGMTEDAYWASMFETRKLMITLENYTQAQKAAFLAAGHTREETDAWHDFCYALTKAAVDAQNITLAAPYSWTLARDNYNDAGTWPELTQSTGTPG